MTDRCLPAAAAAVCCRCCEGTSVETPASIWNRPGLSALAYRAGSYGEFKSTLLARLSSKDYLKLAPLRTRNDEDFTIALLDAFSVMADVLTFYGERIANESYLRTALERRSVIEQTRLVGYQAGPGVAASTYLAFTLEESPGARAQAARPVIIPVGTRVQSIPGHEEKPQTFETVTDIEARVEWNAIQVQVTRDQEIERGTRELLVAGTENRLEAGDVILLVGREREEDPGSDGWDVRPLASVELDRARNLTRVTWQHGLGQTSGPFVLPARNGLKLFVFRRRAALFGHNAPASSLLPVGLGLGANASPAGNNNRVDLDAEYSKILPDSWLALANSEVRNQPSGLPGYVQLYRAETVSHMPRSAFGLSSRITRLQPDHGTNMALFKVRKTLALVESEQLPLAAGMVIYPVFGSTLPLELIQPDMRAGLAMALSGKPQRVRIVPSATGLRLTTDDGLQVKLTAGDSLQAVAAPELVLAGGRRTVEPAELGALMAASDSSLIRWHLRSRDGLVGVVDATVGGKAEMELAGAEKDDALVREIVMVEGVAPSSDSRRTVLSLAGPLRNCYDRLTTFVNANVAPATHGESVSEILGSGDARARDQRFALKQNPLTYVTADTTSGRDSTLEVRVNELKWREVSTLFQLGATEHAFVTATDDDGVTTVQFGDGTEGARLPSGSDNVRVRYRKGLGVAGNVQPGQLSTLLDRPLGVKEAINPDGASGGDDPESRDRARVSAPLTVRTLDRAVSLLDYGDFARTFAGISKARATWIEAGFWHGVYLTIAGPAGSEVPPLSPAHRNLLLALRGYGDPLIPLQVVSYRAVTFHLKASLKVASDALPAAVLARVREEVRDAFSFAAREFEQPVTVDEVIAVIHSVPEVIAADIDELYRNGPVLAAVWNPRLFASPAQLTGDDRGAAELLTIDAQSPELSVMT